MSSNTTGKSILFIAHLANDFLSARMNLSKLLLDEGWQVTVVVPSGKEVTKIKAELPEIEVIDWEYERESLSIMGSLAFMRQVRRVIKDKRPAIVQNLKLKPNIFGTMGAYWGGNRNISCLVAGLGAMFRGNDAKSRIYRALNLL